MRGAPAIAIVGTLSVALELRKTCPSTVSAMKEMVKNRFQYLLTARPTAVNIAESAKRFTQKVSNFDPGTDVTSARETLLGEMERMLDDDVRANKTMGKHGAEAIAKHLNGSKAIVLTHCNTGSLATAGYGTALGLIRALHSMDLLDQVYCTETRPYNQVSNLSSH